MFKPPNPEKTAKPTPLISSALSGKATIHADSLEIDSALDFGGLAVLVDAWKFLNLDLLLADIGTPRQRALLKAMVFARLLFPCSKLALKDAAQGTLLAAACGLPANEDFDEDDLYAAMDSLTGHWCALEKKLAADTFKEPVSLALYDLTSVYFEGSGPEHLARYGHSRDHRADRPQIILAVATDTHGTPLHISILRGNRADSTTLRSTIAILRRRFQIQDAVFVFDGGMSSKINLQSLQDEGLEFVTRLSNSTLEHPESRLWQAPPHRETARQAREPSLPVKPRGLDQFRFGIWVINQAHPTARRAARITSSWVRPCTTQDESSSSRRMASATASRSFAAAIPASMLCQRAWARDTRSEIGSAIASLLILILFQVEPNNPRPCGDTFHSSGV